MGTISIPQEEYEFLIKCKAIVDTVENMVHKNNEWESLLFASEKVAKELWDNKYDEVWNNL